MNHFPKFAHKEHGFKIHLLTYHIGLKLSAQQPHSEVIKSESKFLKILIYPFTKYKIQFQYCIHKFKLLD